MNILFSSFFYVIQDTYFWPSMAFTVMVGIFIGSVIYDGDLVQIKKLIFSLIAYMSLLLMVNLGRILPEISVVSEPHKPVAATVTMVVVTLFYLFGMWLGVKITQKAHPGRI
jgi:hypothetical protein